MCEGALSLTGFSMLQMWVCSLGGVVCSWGCWGISMFLIHGNRNLQNMAGLFVESNARGGGGACLCVFGLCSLEGDLLCM